MKELIVYNKVESVPRLQKLHAQKRYSKISLLNEYESLKERAMPNTRAERRKNERDKKNKSI